MTTKQQSVFWLIGQSRDMSTIYVGTCQWISLAAANGDRVAMCIAWLALYYCTALPGELQIQLPLYE